MKKINLNLIYFFIFFTLSFSTALNKEIKTISGKARIIDGDSIEINKKKIRLFGIDAPEKKQQCKKLYIGISIFNFYKNYPCGIKSTLNLKKFLKNQFITCKVQGIDRYKRYLAICFKNGININAWSVKNGNSVAYKKYSSNYIFEENYAKKNKLGLWKGPFEMPWDWRKKN